MKNGWLILLGTAICVSVPASAALQSDGAGLVAKFMEAVRADPVLLQAARQNQSGAAASAIPALLSYTRANPNNAEGWYLLSMAYGDTGQQDLAEVAISRATAIKPQFNEMTNYLARRATAGAKTNEPRRPGSRPPASSAGGTGLGSSSNRAAAVIKNAGPSQSPGALTPGKYGCNVVNYDASSGTYEFDGKGYVVLSGDGRYQYLGFAQPSNGRYQVDRATSAASFSAGHLAGGVASPIAGYPGQFYLTAPGIGERWTCKK